MSELTLKLDSYEAANLLCLLDQLWNGNGALRLGSFNTGDWIGDVPRKLAGAMLKMGSEFLDHEPNEVWELEDSVLKTREMVQRCALNETCPHCGTTL